ncbi:hypothetical protein MEW_06081 [Candida albicans P60002]|nr:hypothetical protein MEW_06081 [Candida albicans P60002]
MLTFKLCLLSSFIVCSFFVPMYMHICTFRIRRLSLAACSCLVLDVLCITYTPQTIISFFFLQPSSKIYFFEYFRYN